MGEQRVTHRRRSVTVLARPSRTLAKPVIVPEPRPEVRHPSFAPVTPRVVVLLGNLSTEPLPMEPLAREFGWSFERVTDIQALQDLSANRDLVAVLLEPETLGMHWSEALRLVLQSAPAALPIVCQRFSETIPWPDLAGAGAFHSLRLPLNPREIQQSLGFVWSATTSPRNAANSATAIPG